MTPETITLPAADLKALRAAAELTDAEREALYLEGYRDGVRSQQCDSDPTAPRYRE
jgi:hypothetical protein